ncbi:MAG: hypothetical protein M3R21_08030 [Candidatus Dormibacteraeota bacterium]|nr:hypothetical protein [Candidatus Dormibacteraeota bacterium]
MNRLALWATLVWLGMAVAVIDLFTGWTVPVTAAATVVVWALIGGSVALFVAMLIAVMRDRRWIVAHSSDTRWVLARASRGVRWGSVFAIGLSVLLFANCSGNVTFGNELSGPIQDPARFWKLTAWVLTPLLLALLVPPVLTFSAERVATGRLQAARRLGWLAMWSMGPIVAAVLVTVVIGLFVGINACLGATGAGASTGYCAAGAGSITNLFSLGALALFLPYILLVTWALAHMQVGTMSPPGATQSEEPP